MFSQFCHVWSRSIAEVDRAARSQYHRLVRAWSPPQNMDRNRSKLIEHLEYKSSTKAKVFKHSINITIDYEINVTKVYQSVIIVYEMILNWYELIEYIYK